MIGMEASGKLEDGRRVMCILPGIDQKFNFHLNLQSNNLFNFFIINS